MVSQNKYKRDLKIKRVAEILLKEGITMDEILNTDPSKSYLAAWEKLKEINEAFGDEDGTVQVGDSKLNLYDMKAYCKYLDTPPDERNITLARRIPLEYIKSYIKPKTWKNMSVDEKHDVLWGLGLSVKYSEDNIETASRYYIKCENYRTEDNKVKIGLVVVGSERIDKEWLRSGYASDGAILFVNDVNRIEELYEI